MPYVLFKMAVQRKFIDKGLLNNVIRHTDAHNKIQEESEMWKQYELINAKRKEKISSSPKDSRRFVGGMRCDSEDQEPKSTFWTQQLFNFEANDSGRWGHGGYRELYPEEFQDDSQKSKKKKTKEQRWGHSGFRELYPDEFEDESQKSKKKETEEKRTESSLRTTKSMKRKKRNKREKKSKSWTGSSDEGSEDRYESKRKNKRTCKRNNNERKMPKGRKKRLQKSETVSDSSGEESEEEKGNRRKRRKRETRTVSESFDEHSDGRNNGKSVNKERKSSHRFEEPRRKTPKKEKRTKYMSEKSDEESGAVYKSETQGERRTKGKVRDEHSSSDELENKEREEWKTGFKVRKSDKGSDKKVHSGKSTRNSRNPSEERNSSDEVENKTSRRTKKGSKKNEISDHSEKISEEGGEPGRKMKEKKRRKNIYSSKRSLEKVRKSYELKKNRKRGYRSSSGERNLSDWSEENKRSRKERQAKFEYTSDGSVEASQENYVSKRKRKSS